MELAQAEPSLQGNKSQQTLLPVSKKALYDKSSVNYIDFANYPQHLRNMPIGVFDSGTGGFTVLERILQQDRFDNQTGEEKPDGIPDFANENFEYLADQANMPYGRYDQEGKADYLRELAVKDALFLLSGNYWKDASERMPSGKKSAVKIIVIACNTATAYGLEHIQNLLGQAKSKVKVIGVVNAGAASAMESLGAKTAATVGVLATPGTISTAMYYTGIDPRTMKPVYVPRTQREKDMQRALLQWKNPKNHPMIREALRQCGREDLIGFGPHCLVPPGNDSLQRQHRKYSKK